MRKLSFLAVFLTASAIAGAAAGKDQTGPLEARQRTYESPQNFAFELRFAPYRPEIDKEPSLGGKTPYHDVFGSMARLLLSAELDWQAVRIPHLGTLGPGLGIGYTSMGDNAFLIDGSGKRSGDPTTLDVYPAYLALVLRVDTLVRDLRIPFAPYAKAGVGAAYWHSETATTTALAKDANGNSVKGNGYTLGTQFALGVALDLNPLDPYTARNFDNGMGVNRTYFFGEYMLARLDGLGMGNALRLATNTWVLGLTFEF